MSASDRIVIVSPVYGSDVESYIGPPLILVQDSGSGEEERHSFLEKRCQYLLKRQTYS